MLRIDIDYAEYALKQMRKFKVPDCAMAHMLSTLDWVIVQHVFAPQQLRIAAILHDLEKTYHYWDERNEAAMVEDGYLLDEAIAGHIYRTMNAAKCAMTELEAPKILASAVREILDIHEKGGTPYSDILQNAISASFFSDMVAHFLIDHMPVVGKAKVRALFHRKFAAMTHNELRKLVKPLYETSLQCLELPIVDLRQQKQIEEVVTADFGDMVRIFHKNDKIPFRAVKMLSSMGCIMEDDRVVISHPGDYLGLAEERSDVLVFLRKESVAQNGEFTL